MRMHINNAADVEKEKFMSIENNKMPGNNRHKLNSVAARTFLPQLHKLI